MKRVTAAVLMAGALAAAGCSRTDKAANVSDQTNVAAANASAANTNAAAPAAASADEAQVRGLLDRIYAGYAREGADTPPWTDTFEPQLAAALDTEEGAPEADPYTGAQDSAPFQATFENVRVTGDRAEATARFTNMGAATEVNYQLVRTPAGWRIHDIRTAQTPSLRAKSLRTPG